MIRRFGTIERIDLLCVALLQDNELYFKPFSFSDAGYYYCKVQHNLCVVAEMTKVSYA